MTRTVTHRFLYLIFLISTLSSINHAQTNFWKQTNGPYGGTARVVAANANNVVVHANGGDIFRSTDNGKNWRKIIFPVSKSVETIYLTNSDQIFVRCIPGNTWKVYQSTDFGHKWAEVVIEGKTANLLSVGPHNVIVASTEAGLYKSQDSGSNWIRVGAPLPFEVNSRTRIDWQGNIYTWPQETTIVMKMPNNSFTWERLTIADTLLSISDITFKENGSMFVATNRAGVFRSKDSGKTWVTVNSGLPSHNVPKVSASPSGTIIVGLEEGLFRSQDEGNSWQLSDTTFSNYSTSSIIPAPPERWFSTHYTYGLILSNDDGNSWAQAPLACTAPYGMALGLNNDLVISFSAQGVLSSNNKGDSWSSLGTNLYASGLYYNFRGPLFSFGPGYVLRYENEEQYWKVVARASSIFNYIRCFTVATNGDLYIGNPRDAYFGRTFPPSIIRSKNNGDSWSTLSTSYEPDRFVPDPSGPVYFYTVSGPTYLIPQDSSQWQRVTVPSFSNILNAPEGLKFASTAKGVYKSNDTGRSWTPLSLTERNVRKLLVNSKGHYFAATDSGIFRSFDKCVHWEAITNNLLSPDIAMAEMASDGTLFIALRAGGIYRTVEPTTTSVSEPQGSVERNFTLSQNYPNPFNPSTQIQYSVPSRQHFKITMYDVLGRLVETLVDEIKEQGSYTFTWNPTNLPSGVYLYRLESASFTETRKLILMR